MSTDNVKTPEGAVDAPRVSVIVLAYNHEAYLREALDGIVNQRTTFPYEVFVHDDASRDRTPDIIREYQEKYPGLIKTIMQVDNQLWQGINPVTRHVYPFVKGDYIAFCEGDDYWVDQHKLQCQVEFLDSNAEYAMCCHDVDVTYEEGMAKKATYYRKPKGGDFTFTFLDEVSEHFLATASVLVRRDVAVRTPWTSNIVSIDIHALLFFLSQGAGFFMERKMATKRRNPGGITQNVSYQAKILEGRYRLWRDVLAFAPKPYRRMVRYKIAECQRQLVKKRLVPQGCSYLSLVFGALSNNPFWPLGLSEAYKQFIVFRTRKNQRASTLA